MKRKWGEYTPNKTVVFQSFKMLFEVDNKIFRDQSNQLFPAIREWLTTVKLNLCVYEHNLAAPKLFDEPESGMFDLLYLDEDGSCGTPSRCRTEQQ